MSLHRCPAVVQLYCCIPSNTEWARIQFRQDSRHPVYIHETLTSRGIFATKIWLYDQSVSLSGLVNLNNQSETPQASQPIRSLYSSGESQWAFAIRHQWKFSLFSIGNTPSAWLSSSNYETWWRLKSADACLQLGSGVSELFFIRLFGAQGPGILFF